MTPQNIASPPTGPEGSGRVMEVVAALLWQGERFLICQRPAHKHLGLHWEFVGGKVKAGETRVEALARECHEELGVTVAVTGTFLEVTHTYPAFTVHLTLFEGEILEGTPQKLEHPDIRWVTPAEIPGYQFCPADQEILAKIRQEYDSGTSPQDG